MDIIKNKYYPLTLKHWNEELYRAYIIKCNGFGKKIYANDCGSVNIDDGIQYQCHKHISYSNSIILL